MLCGDASLVLCILFEKRKMSSSRGDADLWRDRFHEAQTNESASNLNLCNFRTNFSQFPKHFLYPPSPPEPQQANTWLLVCPAAGSPPDCGGDHAFRALKTTMEQHRGLSMWAALFSLCLFCPGSMAFAGRVLVTGEMRP